MKEIKNIVKSVPRSSAVSNPVFRETEEGKVLIRTNSQGFAIRVIEALRSNGYEANFASQYYGENSVLVG